MKTKILLTIILLINLSIFADIEVKNNTNYVASSIALPRLADSILVKKNIQPKTSAIFKSADLRPTVPNMENTIENIKTYLIIPEIHQTVGIDLVKTVTSLHDNDKFEIDGPDANGKFTIDSTTNPIYKPHNLNFIIHN